MLIATLDDGRRISLVSTKFTRDQLNRLRSRERFYCPVCRSPVRLRLGNKKKWHFSHHPKDPCIVETEPESPIHLSGKEDLFQWTKVNGRMPELERYLPEIRQRPDIYLPGIRPIALEYQCSTLSEEKFRERTDGYTSLGIRPIWILGGARQKKSRFLARLSGFESQTIQFSKRSPSCHPFFSPYYVCYYYPAEKRICFAAQLHPVSKTVYIAREINQVLSAARPYQLMMPSFPFSSETFKQDWNDCKRRRRLNPPSHLAREEYWLRMQAYRLRINYSSFPSFVGLPHRDYIHFSLSPCLWQMWIYIIMTHGPADGWFTADMLMQTGKIGENETVFVRRPLPLCPRRSGAEVIRTYLGQLVKLGAADRRGDTYRLRSARRTGESAVDQLLKQDRLVLDLLEHEPDQ
ncbi:MULTISPECIES: competence protein CoiA [unclassified Sporolactobacillus]|uniref:competence protein CoiA n=1 Tax=unclassified Sporolactobacillus TaxID=2628533 RepID=UPI002368DCED|nr:competence protein CoiA family protein [Sporolactobacillus sp. CQH2019]MDD9147273.1 competence protein CoiA family protein [Sporolactobacillus sp. CQH2019]